MKGVFILALFGLCAILIEGTVMQIYVAPVVIISIIEIQLSLFQISSLHKCILGTHELNG